MPTATLPASPALRELLRELRDDLELEPAGSGHLRVVYKKNQEPLRDEKNRPVTIANTPKTSGRGLANTRARLERVGALQVNGDQPAREHTPDKQLQIDRMMATKAGEARVSVTSDLRARLEPLLLKAGGIDRVKPGDMARIAAKVHGDWELDSALSTVSWFLAGRALGAEEVERLSKLADHLEKVPDARAEWFGLLREVLGLEAEVKPGRTWPFTIKPIMLDKLFADFDYQRPVQENFVRDLALRFDERLVGVLNVSDRGDGSFAIIDGLQRKTAMERVGKTATFCCVHSDLSQADEAALFFHHNRDRKPVHPYYDFRARLVAGDPIVREIDRIVTAQGFVVDPRSQSKTPGERERHIAAIRSLEEIFSYTTEVREESLTPTLSVIWRNWLGRPFATEATILRGMGRFFRVFGDSEIAWEPWESRLASMGPQLVLGRAQDMGGRFGARATAVSQVLLEIHNDVVKKADKLDPRALDWRGQVKRLQ